FLPWGAFRRAEPELWPDSLKVGFNCRDRCPYGVSPVFIRGERRENEFPWLPFGRCAAMSAAANFPQIRGFSRDRDGAPIRLFHAGSEQELPDSQNPRQRSPVLLPRRQDRRARRQRL